MRTAPMHGLHNAGRGTHSALMHAGGEHIMARCRHTEGGIIKDHASTTGTSNNVYCKTCGAFMICLDDGYTGPMWLPDTEGAE